MRSPIPTLSANATVEEARALMSRTGLDCIPVGAEGLVLGLDTLDRLERPENCSDTSG